MFIAVEGIDGAGKTTLIEALSKALEVQGLDVLVVREPGGVPAGEAVRHVLKSNEYVGQITPIAELLLFYASRSMLVEAKIKPSLAAGKVVIADRFELSTFAYQGLALDQMSECIGISKHTLKGFQPDLYLWVDADPTVCLKRRMAASGEFDAIEQRGVEFFERCRKGFQSASAFLTTPVIRLDGNATESEVLTEALEVIARFKDTNNDRI